MTQYSILKGIDFFFLASSFVLLDFLSPITSHLMVGMRAPFSLKCHQHRVYLSCRRGKRIVFDSFITILEHMHASKKKMFFHPRGFCILDEAHTGCPHGFGMAQTAELTELIHSGIGLGTKGVHNIVPQTHSLGSTKKFIF